MHKKKIYAALTFGLATIAVIGGAFPFGSSLLPSEKAKAEAQYDLSDIQPGELRSVASFMVYRRTPEDFASYEVSRKFYVNGGMERSKQPASANNELRSDRREFFIFLQGAPVRGCYVALVTEPVETTAATAAYAPDVVALNGFPHFREPCEGRIFDTTGRLLDRKGYPPEENLSVPALRWVSEMVVSRAY